ncbi:LamG domain-containing protein [Streptomyces sp. NBC_01341]|uniref:LamG domain-containing protein n=1 Tax=Streptomyces sp. NBC_01341 TaxID=2903831 RepID=UPI002E0E016D|nr:LamG domain-containing protein [Streptomyces sp. NBC_01341]
MAAATIVIAALPPLTDGASAAPQPEAAAALTPESEAAARAGETGKPVEVDEARSETSQTFANPDGTFTQTMNAAPVRARGGNGSWAAIDTTLERTAGGRIEARSTTAQVSFSGGGPGSAMVNLQRDGKSLTFGWPDALPEPTLDSDAATYAEVLPGVDLQLTATSTGFSQVLVVKTAKAAENPELERLRMAVAATGVRMLPGDGGGLRFVDGDGAKVFEAPAGNMWDSAGDITPVAKAQSGARAAQHAMAEGEESAANQANPEAASQGPSSGDNTATLPVKITDGGVEIAPDLELLRGSDTVFPVYVDPPVSALVRSDWTALSSDGDKFWEFKGDKGTGYCKDYAGYLCSSTPYRQRLFFEYPLASLYGKKVVDATFSAYQTWSFTCTPRWYDLSLLEYRSAGISSTTTWGSQAAKVDLMGDRNVANGRGSLCSPSQPSDWVDFSDNVKDPDEANENLTPTVQQYITDKKSQITFALNPHDEDSTASWARFRDDAKLSVTYVSPPNTPSGASLGVRQGTTGTKCGTATAPFVTSDTTPQVLAPVGSSDGAQAQLRSQFEVWKEGATAKTWGVSSPSTTWAAPSIRGADTSALAGQTLYKMRARTEAYYKTDRGVTGSLLSSWSTWCYFKVDTDSPPEPLISSKDPNLYQPSETHPASGGVGTKGTFTFTPGDTNPSTPAIDSDVVSYRYRLNSNAISPPITVPVGTAKDVDITPDQPGENVIRVWGYDAAGHSSLEGEYRFRVAGAETPSGIWHLDNDGTDSATATQHPLVPAGSAAFVSTARVGSHALRLNGTTAYAATSASPLDTSKSFTVSAWVRIGDVSRSQTILSQEAPTLSAFALHYSFSLKKWAFSRYASDIAAPTSARSVSDASPVPNVWTHLTGVYDAGAQTVQLYVNGRAQGAPVAFTTPWEATGPMQVGRFHSSTGYVEPFVGDVDDIHSWSRALSEDEAVAHARAEDTDDSDGTAGAPVTAKVGDWDATDPARATGTTIADASAYNRAMSLTGATLGIDPQSLIDQEIDPSIPSRQVMALSGSASSAAGPGPVVDETGSFTATVWARVDGTKLTDTSKAHTIQVLGTPGTTQSSWGVWYEQPAGSSVGRWVFGRTNKDAASPATITVESGAASKDEWVRLTAVYDAQQQAKDSAGQSQQGALFLYVDAQRFSDEDGEVFDTPWQAVGKLNVGRTWKDGLAQNYFPGWVAGIRVWAGAMDETTVGDLYYAEQ